MKNHKPSLYFLKSGFDDEQEKLNKTLKLTWDPGKWRSSLEYIWETAKLALLSSAPWASNISRARSFKLVNSDLNIDNSYLSCLLLCTPTFFLIKLNMIFCRFNAKNNQIFPPTSSPFLFMGNNYQKRIHGRGVNKLKSKRGVLTGRRMEELVTERGGEEMNRKKGC